MKRLQEFKNQFDDSMISYTIYDKEYKVVYANKKSKINAKEIFGEEIKEGMDIRNFAQENEKQEITTVSQKILKGSKEHIEKSIVDAKGKQRWFFYKFIPFYDGDIIIGIILKTYETSEERKKEVQIELYKALSEKNLTFDKITGMFNRNLLETTLEEKIRKEEHFTLVNIDIDSFSGINRLKGYKFGDDLLKHIAKHIEDTIKDGISIRSHSDNFFIIGSPENIENFIIKYIQQDYFTFLGLKYAVSIGISKYPNHANTAKDLILFAETAMLKAKEISVNSYEYYEDNIEQREDKVTHIHYSLKNVEYNTFLYLNYQSINYIEDEKVHGFEALLRWEDTIYGNISPEEFIPLAERNGKIVDVTKFVIDKVIEDIEKNQKEFCHCVISVNISILDLMNEDFTIYLKKKVEKYPWIIDKLEFELTETYYVDNFEMFKLKIDEIHNLGFPIAIDDFGTGFSSLDKLVAVEFDRLKIDRNFVSAIFESKTDYIVLETIINLAKKLGMKITAEGIETVEQLNALKELGIKTMQGFYFSRPMSLRENLRWMQEKKSFDV